MKLLRNLFVLGSLLAVSAGSLQAQAAGVTCKDGSKSAGGQGACSSHGGIAVKSTMKADVKAAKADAKADAKAAKAEIKSDAKVAAAKVDAKMAKTDAKLDAKMAAAADKDPKGAIAVCKDRTYSHAKTAQGACSGHGGISKMLAK